jgi:lipopolysaccharide exporter
VSIVKQAVRGAVWTIGLGIGARVVGAIGTIVIARFIVPEVMGEVLAAWIVVTLGHTVTRMGLDQYLIVKHDDGADVPFHTTFWMFVFGLLGLGAVVLLGDWLGAYLNAPGMSQYMPGCVVAVAIRRVASIPDRVLARDMRFRAIAVSQGLGELSYVATSLTLAGAFHMGGHAIVIGNIVQALVILGVVVAAAGVSEWLTPCRITWSRTRDMMRFGVPLNFETALAVASRMVDNLMFSYRFGAGAMGLYNMAYNLADIPATHVGEHISSVLLPSMSKIKPERRPAVLIRSTALLALLIFPMAVGLGVVADPLIEVLLPDEWQGVAPLLTVLAVLSVFRPVSWVVASYLKVAERTGVMFWMEAFKVTLLLTGIALLPTPVWASTSVGVAFGAHSLAMVLGVAYLDKIAPARFAPGFIGPLAASAVMAAAVLGVRHGLSWLGVDSTLASLLVEIAVGAVVYVPAALVLAPGTARDLLSLLRSTYGRASGAGSE